MEAEYLLRFDADEAEDAEDDAADVEGQPVLLYVLDGIVGALSSFVILFGV